MNRNNSRTSALAVLTLASLLAACGGGGGGGATPPAPPPAPAPPPPPAFVPMADVNRAFTGTLQGAQPSGTAAVSAQGFADGVFVGIVTDPRSALALPVNSIIVGRALLANPTAGSQTMTLVDAVEHEFSAPLDVRALAVTSSLTLQAPGIGTNNAGVLSGSYTVTPAGERGTPDTLTLATGDLPELTGPLSLAALVGSYQGPVYGSGLPFGDLTKQGLTINDAGVFTVAVAPGCNLTGTVTVFEARQIARLVPGPASNCPALGAGATGVIFGFDNLTKTIGIAFAGPGGSRAYYGIFSPPPPPVLTPN